MGIASYTFKNAPEAGPSAAAPLVSGQMRLTRAPTRRPAARGPGEAARVFRLSPAALGDLI